MDICELTNNIQRETEKIIVGKSEQIRLIIMAILSDGHVLLNDLPGMGKTTMVKTISKAFGCNFGRIQFVPDMLPSDITGMKIYNQKTGEFELRQGPVMTNFLLADEINRAIPRTQSALLEAMEERQLSIDGDKILLPDPFVVLATENPVEAESTFKLPAAQMDRFMICLSMGYPKQEEEAKMLTSLGDSIPFDTVDAVSNVNEIDAAKKQIAGVKVSDDVASYIISICSKTREHASIKIGASPRASRALYRASKTWAMMNGRSYVLPDDVKYLAHPVLAHRLVLKGVFGDAEEKIDQILDEIIASVDAAPSLEKIANER